jgi:hypothetical protein
MQFLDALSCLQCVMLGIPNFKNPISCVESLPGRMARRVCVVTIGNWIANM